MTTFFSVAGGAGDQTVPAATAAFHLKFVSNPSMPTTGLQWYSNIRPNVAFGYMQLSYYRSPGTQYITFATAVGGPGSSSLGSFVTINITGTPDIEVYVTATTAYLFIAGSLGVIFTHNLTYSSAYPANQTDPGSQVTSFLGDDAALPALNFWTNFVETTETP
jgi:hypothetical protein